ncbi:hypothetical protein KSF78_0004126 [Schistosoma japonicum]|nr:hypothetical protein KSF78_0004126 [Schistosoma japonicum]
MKSTFSNIDINESKYNSSLSSSYTTIDLCAWCQKPNFQTNKYNSLHQSINQTNHTKHDIKPVPVCCSQICFDNLRRAYFKNRQHQLNRQLLDEIPAMAISGRLPYTSDSDKAKFFDHMPIVNNSHFQSKTLTEAQNCDLFVNLPVYSQLNSCYINKEDIEISTPLYNYLMQRINVSEFVNNFMNAINIDHIPISTMNSSITTTTTTTTETTSRNDDNNSQYNINIHSMPMDNIQSNVINSNVDYDNQLNDSNIEIINLIKQLVNYTNENDTMHNNQYDMNCFNQSFIIPIPIPIFKTATNLLNILHQYGYHSIDSCKYHNNQ